jgi:hypothetical protein
MNADSEPDSSSDNRAIYVIGAVVGVGLVVWAVSGLVDTYEGIDEIYDDPQN